MRFPPGAGTGRQPDRWTSHAHLNQKPPVLPPEILFLESHAHFRSKVQYIRDQVHVWHVRKHLYIMYDMYRITCNECGILVSTAAGSLRARRGRDPISPNPGSDTEPHFPQ